MVGTSSTVRPSAAEASAVVLSASESAVCTDSTVLEAGTAMMAVMITLPSATLIVTLDASMPLPAASAMFEAKIEVSE